MLTIRIKRLMGFWRTTRVVDDLKAGRLSWNYEELAEIARHFTPPEIAKTIEPLGGGS
jgi:hypothetical protein